MERLFGGRLIDDRMDLKRQHSDYRQVHVRMSASVCVCSATDHNGYHLAATRDSNMCFVFERAWNARTLKLTYCILRGVFSRRAPPLDRL